MYVTYYFSLDAFRIVSSHSVCNNFTIIYIYMVFFVFILFRVHWASWILVYVINQFVGIFCSYFFRYFLCLILSILHCWDSKYIFIGYFDIVPQVPEALFNFSFNLFSVFFRLDKFYWSFYMVQTHFSVSFSLLSYP